MGFKQDIGLLQCFDAVGLVIGLVEIVPEVIYGMLSRTLSLYTTTTALKQPYMINSYCTKPLMNGILRLH